MSFFCLANSLEASLSDSESSCSYHVFGKMGSSRGMRHTMECKNRCVGNIPCGPIWFWTLLFTHGSQYIMIVQGRFGICHLELNWANWAKNIQPCSHESGKSRTKTAWQSWTIKSFRWTDLRHVLTSAHPCKAGVLASNCWALARTTPMAWRHVKTVSSLKDWSSTPRPEMPETAVITSCFKIPKRPNLEGFRWPNFGWTKSPNLCHLGARPSRSIGDVLPESQMIPLVSLHLEVVIFIQGAVQTHWCVHRLQLQWHPAC